MKKELLGIISCLLFIGISISSALAIEYDNSVEKINIDIEKQSELNIFLNDWDINITFDPKYPNGENNWYISCVTLTITYDTEIIKYVFVNGEKYTESIVFCTEGVNLIEITAVDWEGNWMNPSTYQIAIDYTPPIGYGSLIIEEEGLLIDFTYSDNVSGINRVEFYLGSTLEAIVDDPPYEWIIPWDLFGNNKFLSLSYIKLKVFDNAGNFIEIYPYPEMDSMFIMGFIRDSNISENTFGFSAIVVYTNSVGFVLLKDLEFQIDRYLGFIGNNFIMVKIWGWWIPNKKDQFSN